MENNFEIVQTFVYRQNADKCFCCGGRLKNEKIQLKEHDTSIPCLRCSECNMAHIELRDFKPNKRFVFVLNPTYHSNIEKCNESNYQIQAQARGIKSDSNAMIIIKTIFEGELVTKGEVCKKTGISWDLFDELMESLCECNIIQRIHTNTSTYYRIQKNTVKWRKLRECSNGIDSSSNLISKNNNTNKGLQRNQIHSANEVNDVLNSNLNETEILQNQLLSLLKKCEFKYNGKKFADEAIMEDYWCFLINRIKEEKTISMNLHSGSQLFDVLTVFFASFFPISVISENVCWNKT